MKSILFLCIHNSARSQMAEALLNSMGNTKFKAFSAGIESNPIHPLTLVVLNELSIDISNQKSKTLDVFVDKEFDEVITLCNEAKEACPIFKNAKKITHWSIPNPVNEDIKVFREVREQIEYKIKNYFDL